MQQNKIPKRKKTTSQQNIDQTVKLKYYNEISTKYKLK